MLIESDEQYEDAVALLAGAEVVAVDTESTGLHMHQEDVIRGISVAFRRVTGNIYSFYVPLSHPNSLNFEPRQLLAALKAVPLHIFHHAIFDWGALAQVGYERNRNFYDTQVGNWLLDENLPTGLKPTAARLWGENEAEEQAHLKSLMKPPALSLLADELWSVALLGGVRLTKKRALEMARESQEILHVPKTWATFTAEDIGVYAAKDTELTLRLYDYQFSRTSEVARPDVIYRPAMERELAFQWVLYDMIATGVRVDVDKMRGQRVAAEARKEEIEAAIGSEVVDIGGQETAVNLRSSRHLAALVYDNWGLECFEHTGSGARSVARSALEPHETHEGVAAILEHKRLAKALSAFYEPLIERVGPGGRVRGHFSSTRTVTGRLASSDPNLQTIPRETTIAGIRECFVPAEGKELWGFDLDQAELRVIAAISKETAMSEPILAGRSIHSETAASVFGPDYTTEQRVLAKGLNFGFCYGVQAKRFAASIAAGPPRVPVTMCDYWRAFDWEERRKMRQCRECLVCRADSILKGYERTYPRLVSMMNYLKDRAKDRGYIPLHIKGRWRHFRSPGNRYPRYYSAMNGVVQGGIAEVMKSVMLRLGEVPDATLCLQVHDELVMEVAPGEADRVQEQLSGILREVNPFSVELVFTKKQWGV